MLCSDSLLDWASCALIGRFFTGFQNGRWNWNTNLLWIAGETTNESWQSYSLIGWTICSPIGWFCFLQSKFALSIFRSSGLLAESYRVLIVNISKKFCCTFLFGFADNFSDFSPPWHLWPPSYNDPFVKIANFPRRRDKVAPFLQLSTEFPLHKISLKYSWAGATLFLVWMFVAQIFFPKLCVGWLKVKSAKVCSLISF